MRPDLLQDRKCVHLKLDKDVHAQLRAKMFQHGLSMQEVFEEFARQFVTDELHAVRIVESLVMHKIKVQLGELPKKKRSDRRVDELDHETIYSMIGDSDEPG